EDAAVVARPDGGVIRWVNLGGVLVGVQASLRRREGWGGKRVGEFRQDGRWAAVAGARQVDDVAINRIDRDRHVIGTLPAAKTASADGGRPSLPAIGRTLQDAARLTADSEHVDLCAHLIDRDLK